MTHYYAEAVQPTSRGRYPVLIYSEGHVPNTEKTVSGNPSPLVRVVPITPEEYAEGLCAMREKYFVPDPEPALIAAE